MENEEDSIQHDSKVWEFVQDPTNKHNMPSASNCSYLKLNYHFLHIYILATKLLGYKYLVNRTFRYFL